MHPKSTNVCHSAKCGRSANKFRKSQIRKFEDLINLLALWSFRKCDNFDLRTKSFFVICGLKSSASPQIQTLSTYLLKIAYKALIKICT
jgi:hypothetical protein